VNEFAWTNGSFEPMTTMSGYDTYNVTVTSANAVPGCDVSDTYHYQPDLLRSAYVIIADEKVEMKRDHVLSGGVGVRSTHGEAKIVKQAVITAAGTFVKAAEIEVENSQVTNQIHQAATLTLPLFKTANTTKGKNILVPAGTTRILTDSVYGSIRVLENATVVFQGKKSGDQGIEHSGQCESCVQSMH
jgi:hypothetical protein